MKQQGEGVAGGQIKGFQIFYFTLAVLFDIFSPQILQW